jgi:TBC1 domain family member 10
MFEPLKRHFGWQLHIILNRHKTPIRDLYTPGMALAQKMIYVGDCLTRKFLPGLWRHFQRQQPPVHPSMYMTQWFVCIFTNSMPFDMVTRVWDVFLLEGIKVVYRVQLSILRVYERVS